MGKRGKRVYIDAMKHIDVVALGIAVMDIAARPADRTLFDRDNTRIEDISLVTGGDAANQAVVLRKLGRRVALSCRLGDDALGRIFLTELHALGVDTAHIVVSDQSVTSAAVVLISPNGQRNIITRPGNNYDFCLADVAMNAIADARALTVGSFFGCVKLEEDGMAQVLAHAKRCGALTFADMSSDKKGLKLAGIRAFLPYLDWFMPSEYESAHLTDGLGAQEAARVFLDAGARNVVIKLGERGVYACCEGFAGYVPAYQIRAVDTTGSGDAFCAGLIHSVLDGAGTREALEFACACGAFGALHLGASAAPFSPENIGAFMRGASREGVQEI